MNPDGTGSSVRSASVPMKPGFVLPSTSKRIEGAEKVTGSALYVGDIDAGDTLHAVFVPATIARGRTIEVAVSHARSLPGVAAVFFAGAFAPMGDVAFARLLQDDRVLYHGQPIALVLASSAECGRDAARHVTARYEHMPPRIGIEQCLDDAHEAPPLSSDPAASLRGDPDSAYANAPVRLDLHYTTPTHNHNAMEPHAAVIRWEGDQLTIDVTTQTLFMTRAAIAKAVGLPEGNVRVRCRYLGGGFGSKGRAFWPVLAATVIAARIVGKVVRLELSRREMFTLVARRQQTHHHLRLGATLDGQLLSIDHDCVAQTGAVADYSDPNAVLSRLLYSCANVRTTHRLVRADEPMPVPMRSPGEGPGSFALESALDELAHQTGTDPLELRRRNFASRDQDKDLPWSSTGLLRCYDIAARAFDWEGRQRRVRSDGKSVGFGMATARYPTHSAPTSVRLELEADGMLIVSCGTQDIGTGTATILGDLVAAELGWPRGRVRSTWGDTSLPEGPPSVGSMATASIAPAIRAACEGLVEALAKSGRRPRDTSDVWPATVVERSHSPHKEPASTQAHGAIFVEAAVDRATGSVSLVRVVAAYEAGRLVNRELARSQYIGGMIFGIGMALHEQTLVDPMTGAVLNGSLAMYSIPVAADMPFFEVHLVEEVDLISPTAGVKGIGMIGAVGISAAIANAVFDAVGARVRHLPIGPSKILKALNTDRVSR